MPHHSLIQLLPFLANFCYVNLQRIFGHIQENRCHARSVSLTIGSASCVPHRSALESVPRIRSGFVRQTAQENRFVRRLGSQPGQNHRRNLLGCNGARRERFLRNRIHVPHRNQCAFEGSGHAYRTNDEKAQRSGRHAYQNIIEFNANIDRRQKCHGEVFGQNSRRF